LARWRGHLTHATVGGTQVAFLLAVHSPPPLFSAHKDSRLGSQSHSSVQKESSTVTALQRAKATAESKPHRRELLQESEHGLDPKLFHRNLGPPGYQPGAPLSVSSSLSS
jgi:hypothetical protein